MITTVEMQVIQQFQFGWDFRYLITISVYVWYRYYQRCWYQFEDIKLIVWSGRCMMPLIWLYCFDMTAPHELILCGDKDLRLRHDFQADNTHFTNGYTCKKWSIQFRESKNGVLSFVKITAAPHQNYHLILWDGTPWKVRSVTILWHMKRFDN